MSGADVAGCCLSDDDVLAYTMGASSVDSVRIREHALGCEKCRILLAEMFRSGSFEHPRSLHHLTPGEKIAGRYEIVRFLARGGMGEVYEARDHLLDTTVALKALSLAAAADDRALARIKQEILLARQLSHPNICRVFDYGVMTPTNGVGTVPFLTMEFLLGETLGHRLRRQGSLPKRLATDMALQMLAGLEAIHQAGIVHRDFKSDNVFLVTTAGGDLRVVVMDFGLARPINGAGRPALTAGYVVGTLDYMAPEQLEGAPPSPSFDIYAFGVVLFETLTGRKPFEGGPTPIATAIARLSTEPPKVSRFAAGLGPAWDEFLSLCLKASPLERFSSVAEARASLGAVDMRDVASPAALQPVPAMAARVTAAWPPRSTGSTGDVVSRRRLRRIVGFGLGAALLALVATVSSMVGPDPGEPDRRDSAPTRAVPVPAPAAAPPPPVTPSDPPTGPARELEPPLAAPDFPVASATSPGQSRTRRTHAVPRPTPSVSKGKDGDGGRAVAAPPIPPGIPSATPAPTAPATSPHHPDEIINPFRRR